MSIDLELFKRYFLNTHFDYKDEILYISKEIKNNKPVYVIIENEKKVYYYFCSDRWIEKIDHYSLFSNVKNCIHELIPPCINWGNCYQIIK